MAQQDPPAAGCGGGHLAGAKEADPVGQALRRQLLLLLVGGHPGVLAGQGSRRHRAERSGGRLPRAARSSCGHRGCSVDASYDMKYALDSAHLEVLHSPRPRRAIEMTR
jgi:hypothetical protein